MRRSRWNIAPIAASLISFAYFVFFLVRYGEMLPSGSDVVSNVAYAMTLFGDVYRAGWSVPKPADMLVFGTVYGITGSLWCVNAVGAAAAACLVYCACRILGWHDGTWIPCAVFAALVMLSPFSFSAAIRSGSGLLSTLFLFAALVYMPKVDALKNRILVVAFLSAANLARPENWLSTYLMIFAILAFRYFPKSRPRFQRTDLLFLIPLAMPAVWHLIDYAVFGDLFYSSGISQKYALEAGRKQGFDWRSYPAFVQSAYFDAFCLSSWFSARMLALAALSITGIVVMFRKQRMTLLFMTIPLFTSIGFYFITYANGMVFLNRYLFYDFLCFSFFISVGVAQISSAAMRWQVPFLRGATSLLAACLAVALIAYTPFRTRIVASVMPGMRADAVESATREKALDAMKDAIASGSKSPVVAVTLALQGSRVALKLRTGREIYLLERLADLERLGMRSPLPDLKGRVVYLGYQKSAGGNAKKLIREMEGKADRRETLFDEGGLKVSRCFYGRGS